MALLCPDYRQELVVVLVRTVVGVDGNLACQGENLAFEEGVPDCFVAPHVKDV